MLSSLSVCSRSRPLMPLVPPLGARVAAAAAAFCSASSSILPSAKVIGVAVNCGPACAGNRCYLLLDDTLSCRLTVDGPASHSGTLRYSCEHDGSKLVLGRQCPCVSLGLGSALISIAKKCVDRKMRLLDSEVSLVGNRSKANSTDSRARTELSMLGTKRLGARGMDNDIYPSVISAVAPMCSDLCSLLLWKWESPLPEFLGGAVPRWRPCESWCRALTKSSYLDGKMS
jgi:hypothetical protein